MAAGYFTKTVLDSAGNPFNMRFYDSTNGDGTGLVFPAPLAQQSAGTLMDSTHPLFQDLRMINGVAVLAGNGTTGTGSPRVTIASDNTPFPVKLDQTTPGTTNAVAPIAGQNGVAGGAGAVGATVQRMTLASDDPAVTKLTELAAATEYETVAASQTAQVMGATGGTGDLITGILVVPATTSPGQVLLLDNATSITVFVGGASSVVSLILFLIPLNLKSVSGAWKITTGANVSVIGMGNFT